MNKKTTAIVTVSVLSLSLLLSACVKNAPQEVKDCCDMVLSDCMDGAVAEFIERVQKII